MAQQGGTHGTSTSISSLASCRTLSCVCSQPQVCLPPSQLFSPLHAALLGIFTPFSLPAPDSPGSAWEVLSQVSSARPQSTVSSVTWYRAEWPSSPHTGWNFNKFTRIYDINNLQDKTERKFHYNLLYLITEMLSFNVSKVILDIFGCNYSI